jgi:hypothetical protein
MAFENENTFTTIGSKHFKIWTISNGTVQSRNGLFGKNDQRIGSIAFNGKVCLTGVITGAVYRWKNGTVND